MKNSRLKEKICPKSYTSLKDGTRISMKDILHIHFFFCPRNKSWVPNSGRMRYKIGIQASSIYSMGAQAVQD